MNVGHIARRALRSTQHHFEGISHGGTAPLARHVGGKTLHHWKRHPMSVGMTGRQARTLTEDSRQETTRTTATTARKDTVAVGSDADDPHQQPEYDVTEWVPPDRALPGDLGQTHLYDNRNDQSSTETSSTTNTQAAPDWLSTRRKALSMDVPDKNRKFAGAELEVLEGRLLSVTEIITCLTHMGALNVTTVPDPLKRMGGADGIVFSTATSSAHLQLLAETLVRQLKARKLGDRGVAGAKRGTAGKSSDWELIDCYNYIVHIMLEQTRRDLNLEALWNGQDELFTLKINNDETVDKYVANNPVPDTFGAVMEFEDVSKRISELQRWNIGHKAVIPRPKRKLGAKSRGNRSR